jgi:hypothetical protein
MPRQCRLSCRSARLAAELVPDLISISILSASQIRIGQNGKKLTSINFPVAKL